MAADLSLVFKAYDIRGIYPDELDEDSTYRIGAAFASWSGAERIALGRDCRLSSPALAAAFTDGVTHSGVGIVDIGLATTDMVYFASGRLGIPGAMFTASHNPPRYNGLKLCLAGAAPVGQDTGLADVRGLAEEDGPPRAHGARGSVESRDMLDEYIEHLLSFGDVDSFASVTVAADAANGMAALVLPALFDRLPCKLVPLYMELDGTFPNHPADPMVPENQADLKRAVTEHGADLGLAFDGDADRVFLVDEHANGVSGSLVTALVAKGLLERNPGAKVLYNLICSRAVPEVIAENGGEPIRTRVGHSFMKKVMAETGAVFGGEHSGHYYFRDHYNADSGLVASIVVLDQMSKAGRPLSELLAPFRRYRGSGEINTEVGDQQAVIERIARAYRHGRQDRLDGLTVEFDDWWFNVRPSNTEPLLRLNVEARTEELLQEETAEVLSLIREG
ncbi:MAG: phosphomannomutase/phosphoglucomutase [Actinomycetota bacterium]